MLGCERQEEGDTMPDATSIGMFALCAMMIAQFFFNWLKHRREEQSGIEPKHNPGIDTKIETRVSSAQAQLTAEIARVAALSKAEDDKLHGRISGLREEIRKDLKESTDKVQETVKEIRDIYVNTVGEIGEMKGEARMVKAQVANVEHAFNRHIQKSHES